LIDHLTTFASTMKLLRVTPLQISCVTVGIGVKVGDTVRVVVCVYSSVGVGVEVAVRVEVGVRVHGQIGVEVTVGVEVRVCVPAGDG
jgi:hypothetical protein